MKISIKIKVFLFTLLFNLILTSTVGFVIFEKAKEIFLQRHLDEKLRILNSISNLIDGDKIKTWKFSDMNTEYYKFIQNLIQNLWKHDEKDTYLYLIKFDKVKDDFFFLVANSFPFEIIWIEFETGAISISTDQTKNLFIKYFHNDYYDDFEMELDSQKLPVSFHRFKSETKVMIANTELFTASTTEKLEIKINNNVYSKKLLKQFAYEKFIINGKEYKATISVTGVNESSGRPGDFYFPDNLLKEKLKYLIRSKQAYLDSDFRKSLYGYFLSIFVPVFDSKNEVSGIIVYDFTNQKILDFKNKIYYTLFNYIMYSIILIFSLSILFSFYLTKPIFSIIKVLNESRSNNFNFFIKTKSKDEFQVLVNSLNLMSKTIYEKDISQKNYTLELEKKVSERTVELELAKEKAEKSSKTKSDFLNVISHELRTPLNGVLGMTDLLNQTELKKEQKEFLNHIESSAENLMFLINNILEITQIDSGRILNETKKMNIVDFLQDLIKNNTYLIEEKKLSLSVQFEKNIPKYVQCNMERYKQVFLNLFSNAIKFTEKGLIEVKVFIKTINQKQILLVTQIKDSGIGIHESVKENLFKEFSIANSNLNRKYGGSGLGLYISKKILEILGGEIRYESNKNKGSSFEFSFPMEILDSVQIEIKQTKELKKLSDEIPLQILVAEDNLVNQLLIKKILKNLGYEVDIANDGQIALNKTREKKYDLIFMDIQMPNMDGIVSTELILSESQIKPQIIALTANVFEEDKQKYKLVGFKTHIGKPYSAIAIKEAILEMKN